MKCNRHVDHPHSLAILLGLGALAAPAFAQNFEYDLVIIQPWNEQYNLATSRVGGLNNLNEATGCATPLSGLCSFIWTLETGKVQNELAGPINDAGSIAGGSRLLYRDGQFVDLEGFSTSSAINESHVVVGHASGRYWGGCRWTRTAKVWDPANGTRSLVDLGVPAAHEARAVNEFNEIVGVRSTTGSCGDFEAFLYNLDTGEHVDIHRDILGGAMGITEVFDINDDGIVIGEGPYGRNIGEVGPFFWSRSSGVKWLPAIPNGITMDTHAYGINNRGEIVGAGIVDDTEWHAFIWDEINGMRDLNDITAGIPEGFIIDGAKDINENGWIIASGHTGTWSPERAVVLIPRVRSEYSLSVSNLVGGANAVFRISSATPETNQYIAYSLRGLGSTFVPQLNVTLGIAQPVLLTSGRADADGRLRKSVHVPRVATGRTVWFQAAEANRTTAVLETTVE